MAMTAPELRWSRVTDHLQNALANALANASAPLSTLDRKSVV